MAKLTVSSKRTSWNLRKIQSNMQLLLHRHLYCRWLPGRSGLFRGINALLRTHARDVKGKRFLSHSAPFFLTT